MAVKKSAADDAAPDAGEPAVVPSSSSDLIVLQATTRGVTYADSAYTSRSLFLQAGDELREFKVLAGRVTIPADDTEALAFLSGHADLQRLDG